MTDDLAGQIRRDLYAIADLYDEALEPVRRANGSHVTSSKEPPLPIGAHILDVRREAVVDLHYWARFLLDTVTDINGDPLTNRLTTTEPAELVGFIAVWVDRLITDHADDADNLAEDAGKHSRALRGIVAPPRREWVEIGPCPRTVAVDGESVTCATALRAFPGRETITCEGCLHDDTVDWWRDQVVGHRPPLVTPSELVNVLLVDLRITVEPDTIRQWFLRGKIERAGRDDKGRWLYDWKAVEAVLIGRNAA